MLHAFLPPSGAASWSRCAMWPHMVRRFPDLDPDTDASAEGVAAHDVAHQMLLGKPVAVGEFHPNGQLITQEMIEAAEVYVDEIGPLPPVWSAETFLPIRQVHETHCGGTPDFWGYWPDRNLLRVVDYKFGHRFVDAFENLQAVCYVSGAIDQLIAMSGAAPGMLDQSLQVEISIVQPRCYVGGDIVRTWATPAFALRGLVNKLAAAAERALQLSPVASTGSHCEFCPGRHACDALQREAYTAAEVSSRSSPVELTPQAAGIELQMLERSLERLSARVEGLRESVAVQMARGAGVPGWAIERTFSRLQWTAPIEQVVAVGDLLRLDFRKPGVVTPTQAIKLGADSAIVNSYAQRLPGKNKLVADDGSQARRVFSRP